jgi:hypothetical protein
MPDFTIGGIVQRIIRLLLEGGLFYCIYMGLNWARVLVSFLFVFAFIFLAATLVRIFNHSSFFGIVMLLILGFYGVGLYFLNFNKYVKAVFKAKKRNNK